VALEGACYLLGMRDRVAPPGAAEPGRGQAAESMVGKVEPRVLPGGVETDGDARAQQLERDRRELDGFGSGSDDETETNRLQLSPWLRRRQCDRSLRQRQAQLT